MNEQNIKDFENDLPVVEQKESIKLTRNTKGYNWDIKLLEINVERLEKINNIMLSKFKREDENN